jgi:dienelactone hydrolase
MLMIAMQVNAQNHPGNLSTTDSSQYNAARYYKNIYKAAQSRYVFAGKTKADVEQWHNAFLPVLKRALGLDIMESQYRNYIPLAEKKQTEDHGYFILQKWIIRTQPDVPLHVIVLIPKNKIGKIPLVITTHGHGSDKDLYDSTYPKVLTNDSLGKESLSLAMQAINNGYIAIAPTMRAFGDTRTEPDKGKGISFSCHTQLMNDLLVGKTVIGDRVWDMSRILDWAILNLPVDTMKIAITGNSGGGTVALFTAACDQRITVAVPSSAFCTFQGSIGSIAHCDCNYIPGILNLGEMGDIAGLIVPRHLCVVNGITDPIFPIGETRKSFDHLKSIYAAANMSGEVMLYEGQGGHKYYPEGAWPFIKKYFDAPYK